MVHTCTVSLCRRTDRLTDKVQPITNIPLPPSQEGNGIAIATNVIGASFVESSIFGRKIMIRQPFLPTIVFGNLRLKKPDYRSCKFSHIIYIYITRGQFWPSGIVVACVCSCGRQSRACPRDNLWLVPARITKFEPDMQNILVKISVVLGVDWPWPPMSNLTWKWKFTLFWACPHDHSPSVGVRISKFWPKILVLLRSL